METERLLDEINILEKEIEQKVEILKNKFLDKLCEIKKTKSSKEALVYYMQNIPKILEQKLCHCYIDSGLLADYATHQLGYYDKYQTVKYSSIIEIIYDRYTSKYSSKEDKEELINYFVDKNNLSLKLDSLLNEKSVEEIFFDRIYNLLMDRLKDNCFAFEFDW